MNSTVTLEPHRIRIAKAKELCRQWMPYLNSVYGPMRCIPSTRCPTAGVDKHGRMYYNPEFINKHSVEVVAYIILHETLHLVLSHHERTRRMIPELTQQRAFLANVAQDLCIQQTLAKEVAQFEPDGIVRIDEWKHIPGIIPNKTSEQYYEALLKWQQEREQEKSKNPPGDTGECSDEDDSDADDSDIPDSSHRDGSDEDDEDGEDGDSDSGEDDGGDEGGEDGEGDVSDSGQGDQDADSGDGSSEDSDAESDVGSGSDGESESDGDSESGDGTDGTSDAEDQSEGGGGAGEHAIDSDGMPELGDICNPSQAGSNSDGVEKEWEEEPTLADIANSEQRLREVEQALAELDPVKGSGAGNIRQALKARLHPLPDPFDQLRQAVARSIASPVGVPELTYRKYPRRTLPGEARLHGVERFQPEATILLDTSGSMDDCNVKQRALAIIAKGISRLQNPRIVCCDGAIQSARRVANMSRFQWDGGGGTDMAQGLIYCDKTYKPDAIVIITDGITDWPIKPLRARVIVALCRPEWANRIPKWMKVVHLYRTGEPYVL